MNMLSSLASDASIKDETDTVGGGSKFSTLESGLYPCTVTMAFLAKSAGGALALDLTLKTATGNELKQKLWMTSGTAKGGKNYYEKDGVKNYLPGFIAANALCVLTEGKEISAMDTENKVIKLYSFEAKAEVPTKVDVVMDLLNKEILVGVIKQTVDKNTKNEAGVYVPSGDVREENEIDKFFHAESRMTTVEIKAGATQAVFANTWNDKNANVTRNKAKGAGANAGTPGIPKPAGSFGAPAANVAKKPATSLFAA